MSSGRPRTRLRCRLLRSSWGPRLPGLDKPSAAVALQLLQRRLRLDPNQHPQPPVARGGGTQRRIRRQRQRRLGRKKPVLGHPARPQRDHLHMPVAEHQVQPPRVRRHAPRIDLTPQPRHRFPVRPLGRNVGQVRVVQRRHRPRRRLAALQRTIRPAHRRGVGVRRPQPQVPAVADHRQVRRPRPMFRRGFRPPDPRPPPASPASASSCTARIEPPVADSVASPDAAS